MSASRSTSKLPYIILYSVIVLIVIGGGFFLIHSYQKHQEKKATEEKLEQDKQARLVEENKAKKLAAAMERQALVSNKQKDAYEKAIKYAQTNADKPRSVKLYLLQMKKFLAGSEYEAMLDSELRKIKIEEKAAEPKEDSGVLAVIASLEREAKPCIEARRYMDAVTIFRDYKGKYARETQKQRQKLAGKYFALARRRGEESVKADKAFEDVMNAIARDLLVGKISTAISTIKKASKDEALESRKLDVEGAIDCLNNLKSGSGIIRRSLKNDIGKTVTLSRFKGSITGKIISVKGSEIKIKVKSKKASLTKTIRISSLSSTEKLKRLSSAGENLKYLYLGLNAFRKKKYDKAKEYFKKSGYFANAMIQAVGDWELKMLEKHLKR